MPTKNLLETKKVWFQASKRNSFVGTWLSNTFLVGSIGCIVGLVIISSWFQLDFYLVLMKFLKVLICFLFDAY